MFHAPEKYRLKNAGLWSSTSANGNNGAFQIGHLLIICSDGGSWEHVSVSTANRCPTWEEMCRVKNVFWDEEDTVIQFHPPESQYVNNHPHCLHMWRPVGKDVELPPVWMVGV